MSRYISNYIRAHRKRAGFNQEELAFLLGCLSGTKVSRYERLARDPNLETAFACQAIFRVPASELFPGAYTVVEKQVKRRAMVLAHDLNKKDPLFQEKQQFLRDVRDGLVSEPRSDLWENPNNLRLFSQ